MHTDEVLHVRIHCESTVLCRWWPWLVRGEMRNHHRQKVGQYHGISACLSLSISVDSVYWWSWNL